MSKGGVAPLYIDKKFCRKKIKGGMFMLKIQKAVELRKICENSKGCKSCRIKKDCEKLKDCWFDLTC